MQFYPRVRAKRIYSKTRTWASTKEVGFLGFAGYKVGMTHVMAIDAAPNSMTKGEEINIPVTILECPPLKISSIKFYKNSIKGAKCAAEISLKVDKELARTNVLPKKLDEAKLAETEKNLKSYDDVRVVVYTQPKLTGIGKKRPEVFELGIGGKDITEKFNFIKNFIGKEIGAKDVFKAGQHVDIKGVTIGKGTQGTTKRFGSALRQHKAEKTKRGVGTLGPWHPAHVLYTVPHAGKMGFHTRTEYNKWIISINDKPEEINSKGGFVSYGFVKGTYMLIKGDTVGPLRRLIRMNFPIRPNHKIPKDAPTITYVSQESKQHN